MARECSFPSLALVIVSLELLSYANGQFNIRVGFHKEEPTPTSSYGYAFRNDGNYRHPTTTLSPTIPYRPQPRSRNDGNRLISGQGSPRYKQKKNYFQQWLRDLNAYNYDKYQLPKQNDNTAVEITVSMMIIRVHSLSDASMDYGIELYYREHWNDYRLRFNPFDYDGLEELNLPVVSINHIWRPDTYFLNAIMAEVDSENSVTHKAFFRLGSNGDIQYSRKISLKADCPMDLTMYPFDVQSCKLKLGSYSNPSKELAYQWVQKQGYDVEIKDRIELAEFVAEKLRTYSRKINYTTGSFDSLELCLTFKRRAGFCIMQVFFPATAVVMSSWVALWLAEDTTFSDVLAVILAIIFLAYAYNSVMPRVSYVKLLDLYMCSCFLFVFLSLAKLVIIKYFCNKWAKENNRSSDFFLDQLLGLSAVSNGADIEQANGDLNRDLDSRRSSCSLSSEKKKPSSQVNGKKANGHLSRSGSIFARKQNGALPENQPRQERKRKSSLKTSENENVDEDYQSGVVSTNDESSENVKNEAIEATNLLVQDETKSEEEKFADPEANSDQMPALAPVNPLAALFGTTGTNTASNSVNGERRVTFFGMEAFSAWFDARNKKRGAARYMKYLRYFHVVTQLALPLAFGAFFVFLLLIYPNVPRTNEC